MSNIKRKENSDAALNVSKMSNEDIQELFTTSFEKQIAYPNQIAEYECICQRGNVNDKIKVAVTVSGLSGTPTVDEFKNKICSKQNVVTISVAGKGSMKFRSNINDIMSLNSNEYVVTYTQV